jgi:hypothetical protein
LKLCETKKLFYRKYLYKLVLRNDINVFFRTELQKNGVLGYAREQLDRLSEDYRNGVPLSRTVFRHTRSIPVDDFLDAKDIYSSLKNAKDYKVRVEPLSTLTLFSNDKEFLLGIAKKLRSSDIEFWEPNKEYENTLKNKSSIKIVTKRPELPLQVYFNSKPVPKDFSNWIKANLDKCKIGPIALESLENYGYLNGYYMYARDEKVLNLITLLAGSSIRSVEKLVYVGDLDKY